MRISIPETEIFTVFIDWSISACVVCDGRAVTEVPRRNKRSAYEKNMMGVVRRPALGVNQAQPFLSHCMVVINACIMILLLSKLTEAGAG